MCSPLLFHDRRSEYDLIEVRSDSGARSSLPAGSCRMLFTVVINVYDAHQVFLPRVLTGLLNQTFKDFETLVIVDGLVPLRPYDPVELCRQTIAAEVVYRPRSHTDDPASNRCYSSSLSAGVAFAC
jgi:hypothetical protein